MDRWLTGDLTGFDPRRDVAALREVVGHGLLRGADPTQLVAALSVLHPLALAELTVGPAAPSDAAWITALIPALPALEAVVSPGGLYGRLCDVAGERRGLVLDDAFARHLTAPWLPSLAKRLDALDRHLDLACAAGLRDTVALAQVRAGCSGAVARRLARGEIDLLPLVGAEAEEVVALAMDAQPTGPALAAWAGLLGPAMFPRLLRLMGRCRTEEGRAAVAAAVS